MYSLHPQNYNAITLAVDQRDMPELRRQERIRAAVMGLSVDRAANYNDWIRVAFALQGSELPMDTAIEIFKDFSRQVGSEAK
jgi:hypothetical protein